MELIDAGKSQLTGKDRKQRFFKSQKQSLRMERKTVRQANLLKNF